MVATILSSDRFQVYWMRKLYGRKENFKNILTLFSAMHRHTGYSTAFLSDTMALRAGMSDNLFMVRLYQQLSKDRGTAWKQKLVISMDTHTERWCLPTVCTQTRKKEKTPLFYVSTP